MTRLPSRASSAAAIFLLLLTLPSAEGAQAAPGTGDEWIYTVRPGDNLWTLARTHLLHVSYWRRLQTLNRVVNPRALPPGKALRVPLAWLKTETVPARVVAVNGLTELEHPGEARRPVAVGGQVFPGDTVTTGADGSLTLEFADGSRLLVGASTVLRFETLTKHGASGTTDTNLRLEHGRAESTVTPRRGRFRISTPAASTVVRGTRFRIAFDEAEAAARAEVTEGTVDATASSVTVAVPYGHGTVARGGGAPSAPTPLLPAPDLSSLPKVIRQVPIRLQLPAMAGAAGYRVQLAPDAKFETLLFDAVTRTTGVRGPDLPDGEYVLRVRAVDEQGLAGLDAERAIVVDARPFPPVLIAPAPGGTVRDARPTLRWSAPQDAAGYRVEVAADQGFDAPLSAETIGAVASFTLPRSLEPGTYSWRVAAVNVNGKQGPFGDRQSFTRRAPPASPGLEPPSVTGKTIVFRWAAGGAGQRYQFQLARDPEFKDLVSDRVVEEPQVGMDTPAPGKYCLRVRTIDTDGYEGAYGPAQVTEIAPPPRKKVPWALPALGIAYGILLRLVL